jgi:hypothetical protein
MSCMVPGLRRLAPSASLVLIAASGAWAGVAVVASHMGSMPGTMGLGIGAFVPVWALMMAAMMLPSVTPFASLYTRTLRDRRSPRLAVFAGGYLIVWAVAARPAYGLAWLADRVVDGHPAAATVLAVAIFAACGVYQLTPVKDRCLARCRSPLGFMLKLGGYRGRTRDLRAGLYHGALLPGVLLGADGPAGRLRVDERDRHDYLGRCRSGRKRLGEGTACQPRPGRRGARPRDCGDLRAGPSSSKRLELRRSLRRSLVWLGKR